MEESKTKNAYLQDTVWKPRSQSTSEQGMTTTNNKKSTNSLASNLLLQALHLLLSDSVSLERLVLRVSFSSLLSSASYPSIPSLILSFIQKGISKAYKRNECPGIAHRSFVGKLEISPYVDETSGKQQSSSEETEGETKGRQQETAAFFRLKPRVIISEVVKPKGLR